MALLDYFRSKKPNNTALLAKERLQIIVAHERSQRSPGPDYLPQLKQDLLAVIRKYVDVSNEKVEVKLDHNEHDMSVLELNITLPE